MPQLIATAPSEAAAASPPSICADNTHAAIKAARDALANSDRDEDRIALACLIEAVAALDERIQGLADGSVPFEGQIYAPKGVAMTKPSDLEGR
ncbi:hypothetical protein [Bradyrhizobium liaoningense]